MFRLIKLGMYALVGYALYELYQGFSTGEFQDRFGRQGSSTGGGLNRSAGSNRGRMQTLTGPGEGRTEETLDSSGASTPHKVGRGVTS